MEVFGLMKTLEKLQSEITEKKTRIAEIEAKLSVYQPTKSTSTTTGSSTVTITDEDILKFIGEEEKTSGAIQQKFGFSAMSNSSRLSSMVASNKLKMRQDGNRKMWSKK
jgi:predicted HTH transcriptional regulator